MAAIILETINRDDHWKYFSAIAPIVAIIWKPGFWAEYYYSLCVTLWCFKRIVWLGLGRVYSCALFFFKSQRSWIFSDVSCQIQKESVPRTRAPIMSKGVFKLFKIQQLCTSSTFVFGHFLAVVLHDYNVKLLSYSLYGGNVACVSVCFFFFLPQSFSR